MDDEDEFGDLYTDVLTSFPSSSTATTTTTTTFTSAVTSPIVQSNPVNITFPNSNGFPNPPPPPKPETLEPINPNTIQDQDDTAIPIPGLTGPATINDNSESTSDSDSDDGLQIVLNETQPLSNHHHHPHPNANFLDDDDDTDDLQIVADDPTAPAEEPDWGDDKDPTDPTKPPPPPNNAPPRPNYPPPYNSFHSQFKYVRPGVMPPPGPGQVRPPIVIGGRGRGDLKGPPMKGGFHSGFWGAPNAAPRGLDFTLPSHKTIFEVDIDNFEEKPWKYPGADMSDFFNFSLNEESWKDYCKQLEHLRLESTMQSKIRVYESGRAEQEFDPDLPPELAAAAAVHDSPAENADIAKADGALGDPDKGAVHARPLLPTGRAIPVETGSGERLPSADTRPPRLRDHDAVIEIVLQNAVDDESADNSDTVNPHNNSGREDEQIGVVNDDGPLDEDESVDRYPSGSDVEDVARRRSPLKGEPYADVHDEERERSSPERASSDIRSGSKDRDSTGIVGSPSKKRWTTETARGKSPHMSSGDSAHDRRSLGYEREDSADSIGQKRSPESFSPAPVEDAVEGIQEDKAVTDDDSAADNNSRKGKEDVDALGPTETSNNKRTSHSTKQQKLSRAVEPSATKDVDVGDDVEASRSSDTSKATGNSRDQKWREGIDKEVKQKGRSSRMVDVKRHGGEGRMDMDRNHVPAKGREDYYSHKEWDPYTNSHFHVKPEGVDQRRERDYSESRRQRRDEDPHGRRTRAEEARKQERGDELVSRNKRKVSEIDRSDKDEYFQSQKFLENDNWRSYHEKDAGLRYRDKGDVSKSHHESLDDHHGKRKKDDDFMRREYVDKQDMLLGLREGSNTRGKREKEGVLNQRKRDDHSRARDTYDNHHVVRLKDEVWVQRERAEQLRDRDEWYRTKQSYEENMPRRDRGEGHAHTRSSRAVIEKVWAGNSHGREEYRSLEKEPGRHDEQPKRRERVEEDINLQHRGSEGIYARGNQVVNEGKRSRQEKSTFRNDYPVGASDNQKFHEPKPKDNFKKARESEGHSTSRTSKRQQGEKGLAKETAGLSERAVAEHGTSLQNHSREGVSSDDEQQDSRKGRSKLERWTSHKDRDLDINSKSSSLKIKEMSKNKSTAVVREKSAKGVVKEDAHELAGVKESDGGSEVKDVDAKPTNSRREDTVERLKKRKERFRLQLENEKDPPAIKMDNESIPSSQNETPVNAEVKQERPPRKRRWLSS